MSYGFQANTPDGQVIIDNQLKYPQLYYSVSLNIPISELPVIVVNLPPTTQPLMLLFHVESGIFRERFYDSTSNNPKARQYFTVRNIGRENPRARLWWYRMP